MTNGLRTLAAIAAEADEVSVLYGSLADEAARRLAVVAAGGSPAALSAIAGDLDAAFEALVGKAGLDARAVAQGGSSRTEGGVEAFVLGQVAFARRMAAHAVLRGVAPGVRAACSDTTLSAAMRGLRDGADTAAAVASGTGLPLPEAEAVLRTLEVAGASRSTLVDGEARHRLSDDGMAALRASRILRSPT